MVFGDGGIQLFDDAEQSGRSKLTLIVDDVDAIRRELEDRELRMGEASSGDFATAAQITDPEGNIT